MPIANVPNRTHRGFDAGNLDVTVAPAGGSDAVGGIACAAARAVIIIYTIARERV